MVRTFKDVGVGDIVNTLTGEAGLSGAVRYSGSGRYEFFQQSGETAREVIATLERDHDCRFFVRNGNYVFANAAAVGDETVEVEYSQQLLSFRPRLTTVQQDKEVQVVGWDPKAKQAINGSASSAETTSNAGIQRSTLPGKFGDTKVLIADRHVDNTGEAAAMAKSALDRRADAHFEAEGRCVGTPEIKAGCKLKLKGVGTTVQRHLHRVLGDAPLPGREGLHDGLRDLRALRARAARSRPSAREARLQPPHGRRPGDQRERPGQARAREGQVPDAAQPVHAAREHLGARDHARREHLSRCADAS